MSDTPESATSQAWRQVLGRGVAASQAEGIATLRREAARGEPEAHSRLALLAAFGVAQPVDLDSALAHLHAAARAGSGAAAAQWRVLCRGRDSPDLAALTTPPASIAVCEVPWIRRIEGFATDEECDWLIARGGDGLARAKVYRHDAQGHRLSASRSNSDADYTIDRADVLLALIRTRISAALGLPVAHFEVSKLLHYEPGQEFALHGDFQDPLVPALAREIAQRGQRIATFLIYLNDDYDGGETEFPAVRLRHKGPRGGALVFRNVVEGGAPDPSSLHAGLPTTRGEKWVFSQWVRAKPVG